MNSKILLSVFICILAFSFIFISNSNTKEVSTLKNIFDHPKFINWYNFWESKIPSVEKIKIDIIDYLEIPKSNKINVKEWFQERHYRDFTLNYSSQKKYVTDLYSHVLFEKKNNIHVLGGSADPYFHVIDIKDSLLYYFTLGPMAFFDESFWISNNIQCIVGFDFFPSAVDTESYTQIVAMEWDFESSLIMLYRSQKLPFYNNLMSFSTYMRYKYPQFIFKF